MIIPSEVVAEEEDFCRWMTDNYDCNFEDVSYMLMSEFKDKANLYNQEQTEEALIDLKRRILNNCRAWVAEDRVVLKPYYLARYSIAKCYFRTIPKKGVENG